MIRSLILRSRIKTQDELVEALEDSGFDASQASVSRDIAALGLVKANGAYVQPAVATDDAAPLALRVREALIGIESAGPNMLVLKTPPSEASRLALAIDDAQRAGVKALRGVAGTIAGDDTIFLAVRDARAGRSVSKYLDSLR